MIRSKNEKRWHSDGSQSRIKRPPVAEDKRSDLLLWLGGLRAAMSRPAERLREWPFSTDWDPAGTGTGGRFFMSLERRWWEREPLEGGGGGGFRGAARCMEAAEESGGESRLTGVAAAGDAEAIHGSSGMQ